MGTPMSTESNRSSLVGSGMVYRGVLGKDVPKDQRMDVELKHK